MGRAHEQDRPGAAHRLRRGRRVPVPAGVELARVRGRLGVHGRADLARVQFGALERDRRPRAHLHAAPSGSATASRSARPSATSSTTSLLVTRIRTIKNEEVTIPNGIVLGSPVRQLLARRRRAPGLILHTSVTIGYDAPWRTRARAAARRRGGDAGHPRRARAPSSGRPRSTTSTSRTSSTPTPTCRARCPRSTPTCTRNIQDAFYEAGVEIMSPHFAALRDGNTVAIPEASAAGYARRDSESTRAALRTRD